MPSSRNFVVGLFVIGWDTAVRCGTFHDRRSAKALFQRF